MPIAIISGTVIAFRFKGLFHKLISIGLTVSALLVLTGNMYIITGSMIALTILAITTMIYGLTVKELFKLEKISVTTMGIFVTISSILKMFHFPGAQIVQLSMTIPILITLTSFIKSKGLTKEMSFMIFWFVYITTDFIRFWTR